MHGHNHGKYVKTSFMDGIVCTWHLALRERTPRSQAPHPGMDCSWTSKGHSTWNVAHRLTEPVKLTKKLNSSTVAWPSHLLWWWLPSRYPNLSQCHFFEIAPSYWSPVWNAKLPQGKGLPHGCAPSYSIWNRVLAHDYKAGTGSPHYGNEDAAIIIQSDNCVRNEGMQK